MLIPQMILPHRFYILTVKWKKKHLDNDPSLYVNEGATGHHLLPCAFQHDAVTAYEVFSPKMLHLNL